MARYKLEFVGNGGELLVGTIPDSLYEKIKSHGCEDYLADEIPLDEDSDEYPYYENNDLVSCNVPYGDYSGLEVKIVRLDKNNREIENIATIPYDDLNVVTVACDSALIFDKLHKKDESSYKENIIAVFSEEKGFWSSEPFELDEKFDVNKLVVMSAFFPEMIFGEDGISLVLGAFYCKNDEAKEYLEDLEEMDIDKNLLPEHELDKRKVFGLASNNPNMIAVNFGDEIETEGKDMYCNVLTENGWEEI
ncbi:hypothetical protein [Hippea alviniae]|uniref:hypothetical protein n=1 Tax=Hippea alviniae TaxID=1279027 RepID=UPI0003B3E3D2|nr:hypothetical protein [Hippea alviniae]